MDNLPPSAPQPSQGATPSSDPGPASLRPSFRIALTLPRDDAAEHIRQRLNETVPDRWVGKGRWAEIHVPGDDRRIWSPYLSLRLDHPDPGTEDGSILYARFAPRPEIWTGVVFLYSLLAFAAVFGGTLAYVQWASNEGAWGGWVAVAGVVGIGAIHLAGAIGRRLSLEQMRELRSRLLPTIADIRMGQAKPPA